MELTDLEEVIDKTPKWLIDGLEQEMNQAEQAMAERDEARQYLLKISMLLDVECPASTDNTKVAESWKNLGDAVINHISPE